MGNSITESVPFPFYYLLVLRLAYRTWLGNSILPVFPVAFTWPLHPHSHPHFYANPAQVVQLYSYVAGVQTTPGQWGQKKSL